jgi:sugar/nucleoside kinase (ribokinase family)
MKINKILCIGAALNDLLLKETDEFLAKLGNEKGGMTLAEDRSQLDSIVSESNNSTDSAPGGSACNTAVGIARLGGTVSFLGKRGKDEPGEYINNKLSDWGVDCKLFQSDTPTGQVLSLITPDAQRTMITYLGAASELNPDELSSSDFEDYDLVHIEGYLLFNTPFTMKVLELAKSNNCKVSLDLSSFEVVNIFKEQLVDLLTNYVDIIIANEDEAKAYTDKNPAESLEIFSHMAEMAIVKLGKDGVSIAYEGQKHFVEGNPVKAIDTTGAGDLWASGFLFGLTQGWAIDMAAKIGNKTGAAVVEVIGATIPEESYESIKKLF